MADVKIGMMLSDDTKSIKKRTDETKGLNKELEKTNKLSKTALGGEVSPGEVVGYNRARAIGGTGAGARDFAKQAEGLGGVVRLYATFAANIFAVSAAFGALNRAAQMERLIQASDLMSQKVGVNLKGLGKDLQEATGYAISFEESMRFANLGTSAGIAAADLKELVTIAKGAAAGLGRDVTDSITRIVQGTAKQEQEILDELGIFIKAKDAYEEYARKFNIEGGADALSAQQRVRAYADAVKQAGQQWKDFAAIPDPFSSITARGQEAINEILMTVNKLVVPILEVLAKSGDAINGLILLISGSLVKRALPELASAFTQVFTFDSAKNKAQAAKARQEIVSEYNKITQELTAAKTIQDKLVAESFTVVSGALGAQAGVRSTKDIPGVTGISAQRLTTSIFGTSVNPKDITKLKSVEDINNRILSTLKEQVKSSKDADTLIQKLIQNKVLEAKSTKDNLILTQQIQQASNNIYNDIVTKRITAQKTLVDLTAREADLARQVQGFQTGTTTTVVSRQAAQRSSTSPQQGIAGGAAAATAAVGASAAVAAVTLKEAFSSGLSQAGDRSRELKSQLDQGPIKSFKAFTSAIKDNLVSVTTVGTGLTRMGRTAAAAGAAVGALGTIASGAFRLIGAAFGPLLIAFSLWEMFGDKIVPKNVTKLKELEDRSSSLSEQLKNVSQAVDNAATAYENSNRSADAYLSYMETINTSLTNQKNIIEELIEVEKERARILRGEKPKTEAEKAKEQVERTTRRITEQGGVIPLEVQAKLDESLKKIEGLRGAPDSAAVRGRLMADYERALQNVTGFLMMQERAYEGAEATLKQLGYKNQEDFMTQQLRQTPRARSATFGTEGTPEEKEKARQRAQSLLGNFDLFASVQQGSQEQARVADEASDAYKQLSSTLSDLRTVQEGAVAEANKLAVAFKNGGDSATQLVSSVKKLPTLSGIGKTEEGRGIEASFNAAFDAVKRGGKIVEPAKNSVVNLLDQLKDVSPVAATLRDEFKTTSLEDFPAALAASSGRLKTVLEDVNEATSDYGKTSRDAFRTSTKDIEYLKNTIARTAIFQGNLNETMQQYESILGKIPVNLLNDELDRQKDLNQYNYKLAIQQAALEKKKVDDNRKSTAEQKLAAQDTYNALVTQAQTTKDIANAEAERVKRAKELAGVLNDISKKYQDIALRDVAARADQAALDQLIEAREARSAVSASPVDVVRLQSRRGERAIQSETNIQLENLARERNKQIEDILARSGVDSLAKLTDPALAKEVERINANYGVQTASINRILVLSQERLAIEKQIAESAARTQMAQEAISQKYEDATAQRQVTLEAVNLEKQRVQQLYEQGKISGDQLDNANKFIEKTQRQIEYQSKLGDINERYEIKRAELEEKALAGGDSEYLAQQVSRNEQLRNRDLKNLQDVYNVQEEIYNNMETFTRRQQAWGASIENYLSGMADAFIDWANTGKFSSKDLFNNLIADIARYEIRMMMFERWQQARKPVMDFLKSMVGGATGWFNKNVFGPESVSLGYGTSGQQSLVPLAKGGAFSGGVEYFAKGGTFTNSIVNSPTLFKAAKGLGVMGEAGPEAIMPLKRDSNGTLGVRSSSSNVEVVVNNYSGEKAQTKETTDSRGNKRIEVIVGEAVAAQVGKTGSPVQRSLGMTYGMAPQLIRR